MKWTQVYSLQYQKQKTATNSYAFECFAFVSFSILAFGLKPLRLVWIEHSLNVGGHTLTLLGFFFFCNGPAFFLFNYTVSFQLCFHFCVLSHSRIGLMKCCVISPHFVFSVSGERLQHGRDAVSFKRAEKSTMGKRVENRGW